MWKIQLSLALVVLIELLELCKNFRTMETQSETKIGFLKSTDSQTFVVYMQR